MSILARAHYARKRGSKSEKFNTKSEKFNTRSASKYEKFNTDCEKLFTFLAISYYLCSVTQIKTYVKTYQNQQKGGAVVHSYDCSIQVYCPRKAYFVPNGGVCSIRDKGDND